MTRTYFWQVNIDVSAQGGDGEYYEKSNVSPSAELRRLFPSDGERGRSIISPFYTTHSLYFLHPPRFRVYCCQKAHILYVVIHVRPD